MHIHRGQGKEQDSKNADGEKYVRGTSSAQGTIDIKSVLMTAGPSRHSGEEEQPVPYLRSALQYRWRYCYFRFDIDSRRRVAY